MTKAAGRLGDLVSQGDLIGNIRETIRTNIQLWLDASGGGLAMLLTAGGGDPTPVIAELAELLARHATQAIIFTPVPLAADGVSVCGIYSYRIEHDVLGGVWGVNVRRVDRRTMMERGLGLPAPIAQLAAELERRQPVSVELCSGCGQPAHASETDDANRCATCVRAAGETPLLPNEKD